MMSSPAHTNLPPARIFPERSAFFLDFDGTLAEIVDDPRQACVSIQTLAALAVLARASKGALAVISGRSITDLDRMLAPHRFSLAGVHGIERRSIHKALIRAPVDDMLYQKLVAATAAFASQQQGLICETKPGSVVLHYRQRPELETACLVFARGLAHDYPPIRLLSGKMVIEMTLAGQTKGDAIAAFMEEPPFLGRQPFFVGDDVTDEAGFVVVNAMGGLSLKIGPGETQARYRLPDTASFTAYLADIARA